MDYRCQAKRFLIGSALYAFSGMLVAITTTVPLHAARWLPVDKQTQALSYAPAECLITTKNKETRFSISIGRAAFRTPLLLGGQAARAGLSCNSCHRNGRDNPDFLFPGLSGKPGTADVTSSLISSHRGDGIVNPSTIPDLAGPVQALKISRDIGNHDLEKFIRGLIVEEFDGPEPSKMTLDGLSTYVRMLSPIACATNSQQKINLNTYLDDAINAMQAAQFALDAKEPATARLMVSSARSTLGMIDERYTASSLIHDRQLLRNADLELAATQYALDRNKEEASMLMTAWLVKMPRWAKKLKKDEALSLFNPKLLNLAVR
jgi:hypothetical protein